MFARELHLVAKDDVVTRSGRADKTSLRLKVKVETEGRDDAGIDASAGRKVAGFIIGDITVIGSKEANVMTLTADNESDLDGGVRTNLARGSLDSGELVVKYRLVLTFGDTVAEEDDRVGQTTLVGALPLLQVAEHHTLREEHDLLGCTAARIGLRTNLTGVALGSTVDGSHRASDGRLV